MSNTASYLYVDFCCRHDIGVQIVGQPARDLCRHFVQRYGAFRGTIGCQLTLTKIQVELLAADQGATHVASLRARLILTFSVYLDALSTHAFPIAGTRLQDHGAHGPRLDGKLRSTDLSVSGAMVAWHHHSHRAFNSKCLPERFAPAGHLCDI